MEMVFKISKTVDFKKISKFPKKLKIIKKKIDFIPNYLSDLSIKSFDSNSVQKIITYIYKNNPILIIC